MACGGMDHLKLTIGGFSFEGWKVRWSSEGVEDDFYSARSGLRGDCSEEAGPHASSPSRTDSDIGIGMMFGESERRANLAPIDVKNMCCAE